MTELPDVRARLAEVRTLVESARSMPMSTSCVVNRPELLALIDGIEADLTAALGGADALTADRDDVLRRGRDEAEQILTEARHRQEALVSDTEVYRLARREAETLLTEARTECEELRRETDDYVDTTLAKFELTLSKTLDAVNRGRDRLRERSSLDEGDDGPLPSFEHL